MLSTALEGKTVLDFSLLLPGPLASNILAQMGAKVIKIEHPKKPDDTRMYPPFKNNKAMLFTVLNDNKEELMLDFRSKEGLEALKALVKEADILLEQFRPGAMKAWGLSYEHLKKINPDLIYCSLTGYGQEGPCSTHAGHDLNYLALTGMLDMNRDDNGKPVIPGVQIADIAGGAYMVVSACLAALVQGKGQYIDVAMIDGLPPLLTIPMSQFWGGINPHEIKLLSGGLVNYNVYQCKDLRWMALGALEVRFWNTFCDLVEEEDWKRQNFWDLSVHTFPKEAVEQLFASKTQKEWITLAEQADCCLSPVLKISEIENHPHLQRRAYFKEKQGMKMPWIQ